MGFFKDFKDDFSQAVGELFPGNDFEDEETIQVNTLDNELDVEQELSKLDGLLEQVEKRVVARSEARTKYSPKAEEDLQSAAADKPEPEKKSESESREAPGIKSGVSAQSEAKPEPKSEPAVPVPEPKSEPAVPKSEPKPEPVISKPKPEEKEEAGSKPEPKEEAGQDIPGDEPQLAPLVLDEPEAAEDTPKTEPEEKPTAPEQNAKPEEAPTAPEEKPESKSAPVKPEPKPTPVTPRPEPKPTPVIPRPEPKPTPVMPKPEPKAEPVSQRPEREPVTAAEKTVVELSRRKPDLLVSMPKPEEKAAAQKPTISFIQKPTPPAREMRRQTAPVPELDKTPGRPAAAWGDSLNQTKTNRSVNIKEEKIMDTTVTATETPVVETAAESVVLPNEPMAPPLEVTDEVSLITAGTNIRGNMETTGSFEIEGRIEGDIKCNGKLTVIGAVVGNSASSEFFADAAHVEGEVVSSGTVKIGLGSVIIGNISATSAVIAGAVKGDIDVQGPVVVDTSAVIMGNIKSRSVQINNGAVIEGFCSQCYSDVDVESLFNKN